MMKAIVTLSLVVGSFAADYFSKLWALTHLGRQTIRVNELMNFHLAFNYGAAFSFLSNESGWQRWFFIGLAIVVSLWLAYSLIFDSLNGLTRLGFSLILGGALGNVYDRIVHGYVVDFIHLHYQQYNFPIFNLADVAITIGVIAIILDLLFGMKSRRR